MTEETTPTYSKITDVFREFFNTYKVDGYYKYVELIDGRLSFGLHGITLRPISLYCFTDSCIVIL